MRVSYLLSGFGGTGGSIVLYTFMDKLVERGYEVYAITPYQRVRWEVGIGKQRILSMGQPAKATPRQIVRQMAKNVMRLSKKLETWGHMQYIYQTTSGLLRHWIPSSITISTYFTTAYANYFLMDQTTSLYYAQGYEELFFDHPFLKKAARLTYYLPLPLITNSQWLQNQIRTQIGRESFLVNPGVDTEIFYPRLPLKQKYNSVKKFRVVSYYAPPKFKGWDEAVRAMSRVFQEVGQDRVEWMVFGGVPPKKPDLPVRFVGKVYGESLAQLYASAHIVFMNSWFESFPLPPIEAMACGTAVVTTRIGTEDYAFHEHNALVIPPRSPQQLTQALVRLINDPTLAYTLAQRGLETASQFTWNRATDRLEAVFQHILQHPPSRSIREERGTRQRSDGS